MAYQLAGGVVFFCRSGVAEAEVYLELVAIIEHGKEELVEQRLRAAGTCEYEFVGEVDGARAIGEDAAIGIFNGGKG